MYKAPSEAVSLIERVKTIGEKDAQAEVVVCILLFACLLLRKPWKVPMQELECSRICTGRSREHLLARVAPEILTSRRGICYYRPFTERRQYFSETDDMVNRKMLCQQFP